MTGEQIGVCVGLGAPMVLRAGGRRRCDAVVVTVEGVVRIPRGETDGADRLPPGERSRPRGRNRSDDRFDTRVSR